MINGFAERLRTAIKAKDMRLCDLAKATKSNVNTISGYISGANEPSAAKLAKIAACLGVSADWLLGLSPVMRPTRNMPEKEPEKVKVRVVEKKIIVSPCMTDDEIEELIAEYLGWTQEAIKAQHKCREHRFEWVRTR